VDKITLVIKISLTIEAAACGAVAAHGALHEGRVQVWING
jgi:hypothetical protein